MRTPVVSAKLKMRISIIGDALLYGIAVASIEMLIFFESLSVNTDLPTDATAMLTLVSDTFEVFVIFRCVQLHKSLLNTATIF